MTSKFNLEIYVFAIKSGNFLEVENLRDRVAEVLVHDFRLNFFTSLVRYHKNILYSNGFF